eukprot:718963-Rhodomonas_salina.1
MPHDGEGRGETDPAQHWHYHMILCFGGFLVQMTRLDFAFAYTELSKFLSCPGAKHLEQAERMLCYLRYTSDKGITFSNPGQTPPSTTCSEWAGSTRTLQLTPKLAGLRLGTCAASTTGPRRVEGQLVRRQSCTTLSSAEAKFVAASICRQEIIYLCSTLRCFWYEQQGPTVLFEDNASCIAMSNNPVNNGPAGSRHIDPDVLPPPEHGHCRRGRAQARQGRRDQE